MTAGQQKLINAVKARIKTVESELVDLRRRQELLRRKLQGLTT